LARFTRDLTHAGIIPALRWLKANPEKVAVVRNLPTLNSTFVLKHKGGFHSRKVHVAFFGPQPKETNPDGTFKKMEFTSRVSMTEEELVKMWGQSEMPFRFLQRHLATWGIRMLEVGTFVGPHYQPKIVLATSAKIETDSLRWHRLDQLPFEVIPAADIDGAITGLPIKEAEATDENLRVLKDELHGEIQLQAPVKPGSASSSAPHKPGTTPFIPRQVATSGGAHVVHKPGTPFTPRPKAESNALPKLETLQEAEMTVLRLKLQLAEAELAAAKQAAVTAKPAVVSDELSELEFLERKLLKKQSKK